jgi:hypothetical protein
MTEFYDNDESYTPPCCRPGGRCTKPSYVKVLVPNSLWDSFVNVLVEDRYWALMESIGDVFELRQLSEDEYLAGVGIFDDVIHEPIGVGYLETGEQLELPSDDPPWDRP